MDIKRFAEKAMRRKLVIPMILAAAAIAIFAAMRGSGAERKPSRALTVSLLSDELEKKIEALCKEVDGVREARVLLTLDTSEEYVYATDSERRADAVKTETVRTDGGGIELYVVSPRVRGVAVVCTDGDRPAVKQKIVSLVSAALGIPTSKVSVAGGG